ncbi:MAG: hypothetical protein ABSF14_12330 [Terriglobia bacterium]|jgi:hypothetical protein
MNKSDLLRYKNLLLSKRMAALLSQLLAIQGDEATNEAIAD